MLAEVIQIITLFQEYLVGIKNEAKYNFESNKKYFKNYLKTVNVDCVIPALVKIQTALKNVSFFLFCNIKLKYI